MNCHLKISVSFFVIICSMLCFYKSGIFCLYPVAMLCICHVHCSLGLNKDYHFYKNLSFISLSFLLVL